MILSSVYTSSSSATESPGSPSVYEFDGMVPTVLAGEFCCQFNKHSIVSFVV